jgi:hypothetical protein
MTVQLGRDLAGGIARRPQFLDAYQDTLLSGIRF